MPGLKQFITLVGVSLIVGSASTAAVAASKRTNAAAARDVRELVRLMDTDMNGYVSKQEFMDYMSRMFDRSDVNRDSALSRSEVGMPLIASSKRTNAAATRDVRQLVVLMDKDKNGSVSKEEFLDFMSQTFDRADVNHDMQLSPAEVGRFSNIYQSLSQGRQDYPNPNRVPNDATTEPF